MKTKSGGAPGDKSNDCTCFQDGCKMSVVSAVIGPSVETPVEAGGGVISASQSVRGRSHTKRQHTNYRQSSNHPEKNLRHLVCNRFTEAW